MDKKFGTEKYITKSKNLMLSGILAVVSVFALNNKAMAQMESAKVLSTEQVNNIFSNLNNDFTEKRQIFNSGEGKSISENQSMYLEKDGVNYFLINPQSGEKFMVSLVRNPNSNILIFEVNDKKGYYVFAKGFGVVTNEYLVEILEVPTYEERIKTLDAARFKFIITSNGKEAKKTMFGDNISIDPNSANNYLNEFIGDK